ncbi:hypothetical protein [Meiothermus sp.]|uniref:hypothetical protein n=1 Tax=Meiothermus sp. TaxID=1955249 RepID=UPI00307CFFE2
MIEGAFKSWLILHFANTWFLVGLIWMVQVVHYPLFAKVGLAEFARYEVAHSNLISLVVGPLMLFELLTAVVLLTQWPASIPSWVGWLSFILVGLIWLTTMFVSVPLHARLATGFDAHVHALLVATNWIRTLAWTARGLLMAWLLYKIL